jgi:hypothetical protein
VPFHWKALGNAGLNDVQEGFHCLKLRAENFGWQAPLGKNVDLPIPESWASLPAGTVLFWVKH